MLFDKETRMPQPLSSIKDEHVYVLLEPSGDFPEGTLIARRDGEWFLLKHDLSTYGGPVKIPGNPMVSKIIFPTHAFEDVNHK